MSLFLDSSATFCKPQAQEECGKCGRTRDGQQPDRSAECRKTFSQPKPLAGLATDLKTATFARVAVERIGDGVRTGVVEIEVREANASDSTGIERVSASGVATLRKTYRPTAKAIAHKKAISENLTRLVALIEGQIVGTVQYVRALDRIHLLSLDVHVDWRRNGVAKRLVSELERIGKLNGAVRLSTYTVTQTGNCEIFKRLGFQIIREEATDFFQSDVHDTLSESYLERDIT